MAFILILFALHPAFAQDSMYLFLKTGNIDSIEIDTTTKITFISGAIFISSALMPYFVDDINKIKFLKKSIAIKRVPKSPITSDHIVPNPFKPMSAIQYNAKKDGKVCLSIYNFTGQKVKTLVDENKKAGNYKIVWDGKDDFKKNLANGNYFLKMQKDAETKYSKLLLLK